MITIEHVSKVFKSKKNSVIGVDDVSMHVEKGEIYGIVGYSGAGKSTLLRCINILERPSAGKIIIDDVDLLQLSSYELRRARQSIGMIFQGFYLASAKTVFENVAFALKAAGIQKAKRKTRVLELLDLVGLADKANQYPAQLSGGQKQRVSIARALANNPKVLLCDEATSALDPSTTKSILALLKKINKEFGITIVLITHEMEVVKEICHKCAVMQDGRMIERGSSYEIFSNPKEALTKQFIDTVLNFELPQKLLATCQGTILQLQFRGDLASDPVVSDMLQRFKVSGNILHGKVEYINETPLGIFIMELLGDAAEVKEAITYLEQRLKQVEVIQHAR
ncbi:MULTISPECIES: methionine ABC transporter ATP-binding protein [Paraliobacillus]|uniref:methionine ABC transporter ATP-binding protein n=1 Tax=Paraliobacillus TaxID=200903 RepID=UPI000DD2E623|nr:MULTISPECIES: methionine ABC transporter ATP-binding protein [Paraliobacillus]